MRVVCNRASAKFLTTYGGKRQAAKKQNLLAKYIKFFIVLSCLYSKKAEQRTKNIIVRDGVVFLRAQAS